MTEVHVDASVIVGILLSEDDRDHLVERLASGDVRRTSVVSAFEAVIAIGRATGYREAALEVVHEFLERSGIVIRDVDANLLDELADAHVRYGKGSKHAARLNMGDCFSYAMAKRENATLLYKGNDFASTDLK